MVRKSLKIVDSGRGRAYGYVASFDKETFVLKYFQDRSLFFNQTTLDQQDYTGISTNGRIYSFENTNNPAVIRGDISNFQGAVDTGFAGITTNPSGTKLINLGVDFISGAAVPEINKGSGEVIYLDNRQVLLETLAKKKTLKLYWNSKNATAED